MVSLLGRVENKSSPNIVFAETKTMRTVMCTTQWCNWWSFSCWYFLWFFKRFEVLLLPVKLASLLCQWSSRQWWTELLSGGSWAPSVWLHGGAGSSHLGVGMPFWLQASQSWKQANCMLSSLLGPQLPQPRWDGLRPRLSLQNSPLLEFHPRLDFALGLSWDSSASGLLGSSLSPLQLEV